MLFGLFENERCTTTSLQASLKVSTVGPPPRFKIGFRSNPYGADPGEKDLVVSLGDALLVNEFELRNDCPDLQFAFTVQIRNIADNEVIGVEGNRVALFDQTPEVVVTTDQFLKH